MRDFNKCLEYGRTGELWMNETGEGSSQEHSLRQLRRRWESAGLKELREALDSKSTGYRRREEGGKRMKIGDCIP